MTSPSLRSLLNRTCVLFALLLSGCVIDPVSDDGTPAPGQPPNFQQALRTCRLQQPGRLNRRVHVPPTHPRVAACLQRYGWQADGAPLPETVK